MVSHDEAFVNKLLTGSINGVSDRDMSQQGELWILENEKFLRFDGTFREYKKKVLRAMKKDFKF